MAKQVSYDTVSGWSTPSLTSNECIQVTWDGPDDPQNPKNWSRGRKWAVRISKPLSRPSLTMILDPDLSDHIQFRLPVAPLLLHHRPCAVVHRQRPRYSSRSRTPARALDIPPGLRARALRLFTMFRSMGASPRRAVREYDVHPVHRVVRGRHVAVSDHGVPVSGWAWR